MLWFSNRDGLKSVAQGGGGAARRLRHVLHAGSLGPLPADQGGVRAGEGGRGEEGQGQAEGRRRQGQEGRARRTPRSKTSSSTSTAWTSARPGSPSTPRRSATPSSARTARRSTTWRASRRALNLWSTNLRTKETKMLRGAQRQRRQHGVGQGAEEHLPAGRRRASRRSTRPAAKRETRQLQRRGGARRRGRARGHVRPRLAADARHVLHGRLPRRRLGSAIRPVYAKYLPHIGNNYEFAEMLSEMLGELNISHSGATLHVLVADRRRDGGARRLLRPDLRGRRA